MNTNEENNQSKPEYHPEDQPSPEFYQSEEYLKQHDVLFSKQRNPFQDFLPVEFFHWCGMDNAGERGILSEILNDFPEYVNIKNRVEETGLMVSSRLNLVDNVKVLLEFPGSEHSYSNENGNFLMYAVSYRSHKVTNFVLDNHKDKIDWNCRTRINDSIYHLAARNGNFRLWDEIPEEVFQKIGYQENKAGKNCLLLGVEGYLQFQDYISFEALIRHFKKADYTVVNACGQSAMDIIERENKALKRKNHSTRHLSVMRFLMGIPEPE